MTTKIVCECICKPFVKEEISAGSKDDDIEMTVGNF